MRIKQLLLVLLTIGIAPGLSGCMAAAVGAAAAGTVAYIKGDLEAIVTNDLNSVYKATKKATEQLELGIIKDSKDALSAVITARDAHDKKIIIKLKATVEGPTELSIRVGIFGNEIRSRLIYNQIRNNLK